MRSCSYTYYDIVGVCYCIVYPTRDYVVMEMMEG